MSIPRDEGGFDKRDLAVSRLFTLVSSLSQPELAGLEDILGGGLGVSFQHRRDRGSWKITLPKAPTEGEEKQVKRLLYQVYINLHMAKSILEALGYEADIKVSSRKGILVIWRLGETGSNKA